MMERLGGGGGGLKWEKPEVFMTSARKAVPPLQVDRKSRLI